MPERFPFPRLSIVTPSYNQVQFLEQTIRSVLLQGYPNLEYIIIDGGSKDGSVEIIRKYEPWLSYWISEPDKGQSDALAKGFRRATGSIIGWVNSDDWYLPDTLRERALQLQRHPEAALLCGDCIPTDQIGTPIGIWKSRGRLTSASLLLRGNRIFQPTVLMRRDAFTSVGGLDPRLNYILDYELWVRLGLVGELRYLQGAVAYFRHHATSKTVRESAYFYEEMLSWLDEWPRLHLVLTEEQSLEARRRLHVQAALEYVYAGELSRAQSHFQQALLFPGWPFGSLDKLATAIVRYRGMDQRIRTTEETLAALRQVLLRVGPKGNALWSRTISRQQVEELLTQFETMSPLQGRMHLLKGMSREARWLLSPGILALFTQAFLGLPIVAPMLRLREVLSR